MAMISYWTPHIIIPYRYQNSKVLLKLIFKNFSLKPEYTDKNLEIFVAQNEEFEYRNIS